jgi:hypothetical protein
MRQREVGDFYEMLASCSVWRGRDEMQALA